MSDSRTPLRVLLIEDSENDAMLLLRELRRGGYEPLCQRVDTPEDMEAALRDADDRGEPWEIIISDYYMPRFRGTDALAIVKRLGYDMPFIVVSGKVGEDLAVEIMKAGAQDYITKENMARLNPAIERELREAGVRRERLRIQEALDRSEERFRRLVEQAADAMFVYDLEGRFMDVNRQACESLGYTREELLALSVPDVEMDYESGSLEKLWRQVSSGTHRTLEGMHRRKDGTTFPVEVRLGMFESEGMPLMLATARDVTDRKKAEDELRESEERFRALVQNASDIIIILGPDGTVRYESLALERILGYKPEERIGKKVSDLIHPDDLEHVSQAFEAYVKDPSTHQTVEYRVRARDGSWHHFEGIGNNLIGDPSVRGLVVNARDITDRKRAEREIRESEEKYRTLFETMTQGIIYQDTEGMITSANPAAERILGLSLDQMQSMLSQNSRWRTIREDGSDLPAEEYPISVALRTGERVTGVIGVFVPERDEYRWINVTAMPQFRPGEDRPYQAYAIFDDITDRKRAEEELQWSERSLSEAQRLAHLGNWRYEVDRDQAYWSDELYRIFGLVPQQFVPTYRTFLDYVHRDDKRLVREAVRAAWQRVDRSSFEYRIVRPDGEVRTVSTRYECVRNIPGRPVRLIGTIQDITYRKRAEEALRLSEIRFRTIIEQSPLSVQILSPDGRTLRVNRAWEELWGATLEDLGGYNLLEDQQLVDKGIMPYIRRGFAGEPTAIPAVIYDPDESIPELSRREEPRRWVQAFIYPVKDESGDIREVTLIHEDVTDRKRAEQALRESEEHYRIVAETASDGIVMIDEDSRILFANGATVDIFGYDSEEELVGRSLTMLMPEYLRQVHEASLKRYLDTGERHLNWGAIELPGLCKSGEEIPLEVSFGEFFKEGRRFFTGFLRDITERKRNEAELARLATFPKLNPAPIIETDVAGNITYLNPAADAWFQELADRAGHHLLLADLELIEAEIHRSGGRPLNREVRVAENYYLQTISRLPESGLLRIYAMDITERRRAEEDLRRSEELYRVVVEQAGEGIFLFDAETKQVLETNSAFQRMLGYTSEELGRMKLYDVISEDPESVDQNVRRTLEQGRLLVGERAYQRKDGSTVDVEVSGSIISYRGKEVLCAVARDITERKQAEETLREAREAERNRIARDLHDDILQDIVYALQEANILQALSEDGGAAEELGEIADALRRSVEGLREAIFELRLEDTLKQSFAVSLRSLVELHRRMSRQRYALELSIEEGFPEDIPYKTGRELIRVLQEALNNARWHARPRHVWVRLGADANEVWAEVADDGQGFDPWTSTGGVGQHSMRQRIRDLGGELRVESEPGTGTTVCFRIPYSRLVEE